MSSPPPTTPAPGGSRVTSQRPATVTIFTVLHFFRATDRTAITGPASVFVKRTDGPLYKIEVGADGSAGAIFQYDRARGSWARTSDTVLSVDSAVETIGLFAPASTTVANAELETQMFDSPGAPLQITAADRRAQRLNVRPFMATLAAMQATLAIASPSGDPATQGSAQNQFAFTHEAVLSIPCRATLSQEGLADQLRWTIDAIGDSPHSWDPAWPGTGGQVGRGLTPTVTCRRLPSRNSHFGTKTIRVTIEGTSLRAEQRVQIFFPAHTTARPHSSLPTFAYYWAQAVDFAAPALITRVEYFTEEYQAQLARRGASAWAYVPAMKDWSPTPQAPSIVVSGTIAPQAVGEPPPSDTRWDGSGQRVSGIDLFANVVRHENQHVAQIAYCNQVVPNWSFNQSLFESNHHGFDVNPRNDVPDAYENTPAGQRVTAHARSLGGKPFLEAEAGLQETVAENHYRDRDWTVGGKQHYQRPAG